MLRKAIPILLAVVLFSPAAMAKGGERYLGLKVIMSPWGEVDYETSRGEDELVFGYGFGLWLEGSIFSFLSLGGAFDVRRFDVEGFDEHGTALNFDPLVRLYFPGRMLEPYLKAQFGLSLFWPPESDGISADMGPGFNWQAFLGLVLRFGGFGLFAELGMGQTMGESHWHVTGTDHEQRVRVSHLDTNLGVVFVF